MKCSDMSASLYLKNFSRNFGRRWLTYYASVNTMKIESSSQKSLILKKISFITPIPSYEK